MLDKNKNYVIENYHLKSAFSSFLPGISGEHGIPLWCYYVNRGQCVSCFGIQDKDHPIMEFYPAHQAYERTPLLGFRTFLRVNGAYEEPFSGRDRARRMVIGMNSLTIEEETGQYRISAEYETLPQESVAALMREVKITNVTGEDLAVEAADGMAEVIPCGVSSTTMKDMGQTAKAWMEVRDVRNGVPKFRVRASMEDSAEVTEAEGMNFAFARGGEGEILPVIVDRELLFETDTALLRAWGFEREGVRLPDHKEQVTCNDTPCSFFLASRILKPGETLVMRELYGTAKEQTRIDRVWKLSGEDGWFLGKQREAFALTEQITSRIAVKTGHAVFDAYCRQDYLDNLLRGGYPVRIGSSKTFYLYSRKHGDMERDYNFFSMLPEPYTQGNGNFRDVCQNRRCDVYFSPFVGDSSIRTFYNALQLNGYNPLGIEKVTYTMPEGQMPVLEGGEAAAADALKDLFTKEFTPGQLDEILAEGVEERADRERIFAGIMDLARSEDRTRYGEGYWCDHWTYNLDLVEAYLAVYPERREALLFEEDGYSYRQAEKRILPRRKRYVKTEQGIRQYHFLEDNADTERKENRYLKDQNGCVVTASLASKMMTLVITRMAALDPYGMGLEMEGGKPGWYDALNGLPGLLGSSMAETYELLRCAAFLIESLEKTEKSMILLEETAGLAGAVCRAGQQFHKELAEGTSAAGFWNAVNDAKEHFWDTTSREVSGERVTWEAQETVRVLTQFSDILRMGIRKAARLGRTVRPTYFYYEVTEWKEELDGILPQAFRVHNTPDFLEGSVHYMKIAADEEERKAVYESVRASRLYDDALSMYKVNASLSEATFELGRACAFTPGWLENESVWLHMEYKYLLELLKAGMYQEFTEDFHKAAVPFLNEEQYGRSLLENSSFIASSANPNPRYHGKGFVARLSGGAAEFLEMWEIMMFGKQPFSVRDGKLELSFEPCFPEYLTGKEKTITATFLGSVPVTYKLPEQREVLPGTYTVEQITVETEQGEESFSRTVTGPAAEMVREGRVRSITVSLAGKL